MTAIPVNQGPPQRHPASALWFPVFFAIVFPLLFLWAFHSPQPRDIPVGVVGSPQVVQSVRTGLGAHSPGGFTVRELSDAQQAVKQIADRTLIAAYVPDPTRPGLYVATAAGRSQALSMEGAFSKLAAAQSARPPIVHDVVPLLSGDGSGVGLFFTVFPLNLVGLVLAISLLQLPQWSVIHRLLAIAGAGAIATAAAYVFALDMNVIADKPILLLYMFLFTQAMCWLLCGASPLLKQHFTAIAMTFALILSVPASGGSVSADMLPTPLRWLSEFLPLSQMVKIARSVVYFHAEDLAFPLAILVGWAVLGAAIFWIGARQAGNFQRRALAPTPR